MEPSGENVPELVKNSLLYVEFLAEREEILRHKWIESEKAGHDIGFDRALLDWTIKHRSAWRENRREASGKPANMDGDNYYIRDGDRIPLLPNPFDSLAKRIENNRKVVSESGWFAPRPSGTEYIYKL